MPIIFSREIGTAKKLAVWEITEPLDFFLEKLQIQAEPGRNEKRQAEQACSKLLLNMLYGDKADTFLFKDEFGKPFLSNLNISVSFSHSKNMVSCLLDVTGDVVGTDIEYLRPNIDILAPKFMNNTDKSPLEGKQGMQLIWGAKEVLYKIYGKKGLDFRTQLHIQSEGDEFKGQIQLGEISEVHPLDYTILGDFILVWNLR